MNLHELEFESRKRDHIALMRLDARLTQADQHRDVREDLLSELGFWIEEGHWHSNRWSRAIERFIFRVPAMSLLVIGLILEGAFWLFNLVSVAHRELALRSLLFPILAVVAGYQNWRRSRINSTVDDALKRRDMANAQITNNPELLRPYVGSALLDSPNAPATDRDNSMETKIDMYIYNEIDNLEFVFDKANHNLIDDVFIMRAIKIFIARNENPLFRSRSVVLLTKGRYNHDFRFAAETLILVGEWRSKLTGIRP